jgi:hypothetical protein
MQQALAIAQQGSQGLTLLYSRSETKPGGQIWGFYFLKGKQLIECEISGDGTVLVNKTVPVIPPPPAPTPTPIPPPPNQGKVNPVVVAALQTRVMTKIPNFQYIEIALQQNPGFATSFTTILVQNQLQVQVGGQSQQGDSWTVTMDMTTGQIIR